MVNQIVVYRVENVDNQGPYFYNHGTYIRKPELEYIPSIHLEPFEEDIEIPSSRYVCGFSSIEQMRTWFSKRMLEEIVDASGDNFFLNIYNVDSQSVNAGLRQVVFDSSAIELISSKRLSDASLIKELYG